MPQNPSPPPPHQVRTQMQSNLYTASTGSDDVSLASMSYKDLALTSERRHVTAGQCVWSVFANIQPREGAPVAQWVKW